MNNKLRNGMLILVIVLALVLGSMVYGVLQFRSSHIFVEKSAYPADAASLDLRGEDISLGHFQELSSRLPDCQILWNVPFQGSAVSNDSTSLKVTALSQEDVQMLACFPQLQTLDARGCTDYERLVALEQQMPGLEILYTVTIDGQTYDQDATEITVANLTEEEVFLTGYLPRLAVVNAQQCQDYIQLAALQDSHPGIEARYNVQILGDSYPWDTQELKFSKAPVSQLSQQVGYLSGLRSVHLTEPEGTAQELLDMVAAHPDVNFTWEKTVLGELHTSAETEFDFSGRDISTSDVEQAMAYFPNAEKVIMSDCGIDNETMAAFREKMRPEYKVVWTVVVTGQRVRTDDTVFHSSGRGVCMIDEQTVDLYYCEDMIVVDVGHSYIKNVDWVKGMPNLKYLILADNWLKDISALSTCKNLIYLELFINQWLKDLSPVVGCTALEDLSVSDVYADLTPLAEMHWLKNLWANNVNASAEEKAALQEGLPNTRLMIDRGGTTGGGWRQLQNYYDMRDIMGLPYNKW